MSDDFEVVGDEALEARVVAVILGEASGFEEEEVARLCEENPELGVFRRRVEAVHGLVGESRVQNPDSRALQWKLSKDRRAEVLAKLGEKETVVAGPKKKSSFFSMDMNLLKVAACVAFLGVIIFGASVSTIGRGGRSFLAIEKSASDQIVFEDAPMAAAEKMKMKSVSESVARRPVAPAAPTSRAIAANTSRPSEFAVLSAAVPEAAQDFGNGDDFGDGWGSEQLGQTLAAVEPEEDEGRRYGWAEKEVALGSGGGGGLGVSGGANGRSEELLTQNSTSRKKAQLEEEVRYTIDAGGAFDAGLLPPLDAPEESVVSRSDGQSGDDAFAAPEPEVERKPARGVSREFKSGSVTVAGRVREPGRDTRWMSEVDGEVEADGNGMSRRESVAQNGKVALGDGSEDGLTRPFGVVGADSFAAFSAADGEKKKASAGEVDPFASDMSDEVQKRKAVATGAFGELNGALAELRELEANHPNNVDHFAAPSEEEIASYDRRVEEARDSVLSLTGVFTEGQVAIKTKSVEVSQNNQEELGFDWLVSEFDEGGQKGEGRRPQEAAQVPTRTNPRFFAMRSRSNERGEMDNKGFSGVAGGGLKSDLSLDFVTEYEPPELPNKVARDKFIGGGFKIKKGAKLLVHERVRREASTDQAVDLLMEGRKAYAAKDYEEANRLYKESLNTLPLGPKTEVKRNEITAHLADGSVALAQQYRRLGKYDEAKGLLNDVLLVDPERFQSEESLGFFDDPIRVNPSLTHEHSADVDEVRRLLYQAEGFYNLADFDQAEKKLHAVLEKDKDNKAARRWLERTAAIKSDYYRAAYDQTRANFQMNTDAAWELTVPNANEKVGDELGLMSALGEDRVIARELQSASDELTGSESWERESSVGGGGSGENGKLFARFNKLQSIVIPRIDFEETSLEEALEFLTQKAIELDPYPYSQHKGVDFVVEDPSVDDFLLEGEEGESLLLGNDPSEKKIDKLQLRNVPLATALEYICNKTGLRYRVDEYAVTLLPIGLGASADLVTRTWVISPEAYAQMMAEQEKAEDPFASDEELTSEQDALMNSGVDFPGGASVRYLPESGVLIIRNTVSNLDIVDQLLETVERQAKVAQETLAMDEKDAATQGDSTFSLHVSDVSFKLAKAALDKGEWPETVRVEEFVNAFSYGEQELAPEEKVGVAMEQVAHPFLSQRNLLRMSLQTAATGRGAGVPLRLTVVLDKSGSMERVDRAEAVEEAFQVLVEQLQPGDKVTLIGFSRTPSLLADFVDGSEGPKLLQTLQDTPSEGGTNVEEALGLALAKSLEHYEKGAQNRVILLTDGIANLGASVPDYLMKLVEGMREQGVAFDACGVGADGLNDEVLEALTRKGDGRYYLLGSKEESGAEFAKQVAGSLRPAAQNVKVQIEWNPSRVGKWRLYGFEKHELKKEDFRNDSVDAAEMAAEEEGVALYHVEVKPDGMGPLGVARVRFRDMASNEMVEREWEIAYEGEAERMDSADRKVRLAAVAGLTAEKLARSAVGERVEWDDLLRQVRQLKGLFPREKRVSELEEMIELAKGME